MHTSTTHQVSHDTRRGLGFRMATAAVCAGTFAGLSGLVAPAANAEHPVGGRWQDFENDQAIYWHPLVSDGYANQVGGGIRAKWGETTGPEGGWELGPLAYPTTREWSSQESASSDKLARG